MIYYVEDDDNIRDLTVYALRKQGIEAEGFSCDGEFKAAVARRVPDAVLLDIMLPDTDGLAIMRRLRADRLTATVPIMMLTAKDTELDKVMALDGGADDYLTKPIKMKLLVSRVQAILKRIDADRPPEKAPAPGLTVDRERYTVIRDGQEITLPRKEFALLDLLHSSPGKLIPREEIYAKIWGTEVVVGDRTIDVHIRKLRQKIGDERIVTVKGVGYKYEP